MIHPEEDIEEAVDDHAQDKFDDSIDAENLSWKLRDLDHEYPTTPQGARFFGNVITAPMILQILLAVFYSYGTVQTMYGETTEFYVWPPNQTVTVDLLFTSVDLINNGTLIRSDEESLQCDGYDYYQDCFGPKFENVTEIVNGTTTVLTSPATAKEWEKCNHRQTEEEVGFAALGASFYLNLLIGFAWNCALPLYISISVIKSHKYNKALGLVTFRKTATGIVVPAKLGFAFTILCNYSRAPLISFITTDLCGRYAWGFDYNQNTIAYIGNLMAAFAHISLALAASIYIASCGTVGKCFLDSPKLSISLFRVILLLAVLGGMLSDIADFNIDVDFDWNYPTWATVSLISWIDFAVSALADVYIAWCI